MSSGTNLSTSSPGCKLCTFITTVKLRQRERKRERQTDRQRVRQRDRVRDRERQRDNLHVYTLNYIHWVFILAETKKTTTTKKKYKLSPVHARNVCLLPYSLPSN